MGAHRRGRRPSHRTRPMTVDGGRLEAGVFGGLGLKVSWGVLNVDQRLWE